MDADTTAKVLELAAANPTNIGLNSLDAEYAGSLEEPLAARLAQCLKSGIENPDSKMGCYAMQPADYDELKPFFSKALASYHGVPEDATHVNDWSLDGLDGLPEGGVLDLAALGLPALSMRVRVGRNLAGFPLPGAMTAEDRTAMETKMLEAFNVLIANPDFGGRCGGFCVCVCWVGGDRAPCAGLPSAGCAEPSGDSLRPLPPPQLSLDHAGPLE